MRKLFLSCMLATLVSACGGASLGRVASETQGQTIAVVSLSVNNYANSLQGWNQTRTSDLMMSQAANMVGILEAQLGTKWQVVPAPNFVARLQPFAGAPFDVAIPKFPEGAMPVIARARPELVGGRLSPEMARALTQTTGTNLVAVLYSEWGVRTGSMVPTSKALAKNVLSIYDATGRQIYHGRVDIVGERTLGAFGRVVVDQNSINEWVEAYARGIATMLGS